MLRKFHPDLQSCELEDRLVPVISNLGVIVLTPGGYALVTPYPGAAADPGGTAIPTSFSITGSGGISRIEPGSIAGIPGPAATATAGSSGGANTTTSVVSGPSDATAAGIPLVTRNTIANDALVPPARIGRPSGDGSPVLPVGQFYRGGTPETVPGPPASGTPGGQSSRHYQQGPVDSTSNQMSGAPPRSTSDAAGNSIITLADRMP